MRRRCLLHAVPPTSTDAPVTNIRNASSPHWRMWLNPVTKKKDVVWFALNQDRPLFAFAGIWTTFSGDRGTKSKPIPGPHEVHRFLTTDDEGRSAVDLAATPCSCMKVSKSLRAPAVPSARRAR